MDNTRFIESEFLSESSLIDKGIKTRTLNIISEKVNSLSKSTQDSIALSTLESIKLLIEDAYILTMYKFQFKIFTLAINKDIENIEKIINHGN